MAVKKIKENPEAKAKAATESVPVFTRAQLAASAKYGAYRDFLNGNLKDGKSYTFDEVDALIDGYYKQHR